MSVKDIKIKPGISNNDLAHKMKNVARILEKGDQVRLSIILKSAIQKRMLDSDSMAKNLLSAVKYYLDEDQVVVQELAKTVDCPVRIMLSVK